MQAAWQTGKKTLYLLISFITSHLALGIRVRIQEPTGPQVIELALELYHDCRIRIKGGFTVSNWF